MKHHNMFGAMLWLLAIPVLTLAAEGAPEAGTSDGITEIILEQTWCYGACPVDKVVFRRDDTAEYTGIENTRFTGAFTGRIPAGSFNQMAKRLVADGFFSLDASHGRNNVDLPSQVIRVRRGAALKSVVNYSMESSSQVRDMDQAVRAIVADIPWKPLPSGSRGKAAAKAMIWISPEPQAGTPSGMRESFFVRADGNGRFEIPLAPGTYVVSPDRFLRPPGNDTQTVVGKTGRSTEATLR